MKSFKDRLLEYKTLIDCDIDEYVSSTRAITEKNYGRRSLVAFDPYSAILQAGGKRLRGTLTMIGYEMMGGSDKVMILQAARALEMLHAYILIIDDIQDRSLVRRDGPTAHRLIAEMHRQKQWKDEADHIGIALGINAAVLGNHTAQMLMANLDVSDELRVKVLNITNHTLAVTLHGQTNDLLNEIADDVSEETIENVMQWKTAHYTALNPIHVGMVLAGAPCEDTNAITEYALHLGKAFQITDDLLIFSEVHDGTGKDPIDDVREGKQTLCTMYAFKHAPSQEVKFIKTRLGKKDLSTEEFKQFKDILISCGAVDHARSVAANHVTEARKSLATHKARWAPEPVAFLDDLAVYILLRKN